MLRNYSTKLFSPFSSHSPIHKSSFSKTRQLRFYSTQFNDEIRAEFRPKLSVVGIGGGGCNTVENMLRRGVEGVDFYVCNTDSQVLEKSKLPMDHKIQLGSKLTGGLGAGAKPDIGKRAAEEALDLLVDKLKTSHLCFITAGMGGGTGTGASPVVGKALREKGVLCIGVVTKPFFYEGRIRMNIAEEGINEMKNSVDTLIVVPNQRVISNDRKQLFAEAFDQVNNVLYEGIKSVTDVIITPGLINLDFADVKTITKGPGWGLMGTGRADGKERARDATNAALNNPLLSETTKQNATGVLVSIAGGQDLGLLEIDEVVEIINKQVNKEANVIFGTTTHDELEGSIQVSLIITGPWESESALQTKEQIAPVVTPQTPLVKSFSSNDVRQQPKTRIAHETKSFKPKEEKFHHEQQKEEATPTAPEQSTKEDPKSSGWFSRWI